MTFILRLFLILGLSKKFLSSKWSGFKVRYIYKGDSLSDYEATCIVKAKDEKEAVKIAAKKVNDDAARNFRIDGRIDSYKQYKKDFPHSGFKVFEDVDEAKTYKVEVRVNEGTYDGVPVVAVPHEFSSQDWNSKKVSDRIKIYLDYFKDAEKSKRKMSKSERDDNFRKLEKICLGIQSTKDYSDANALLNIADNNGFVYKKYIEKLVNDLRTGKKFNLKYTPTVVEDYEDITEALKVVKSGKVQIKKAFTVKEFDEDDGWVETKIKPGTYKYQVLDFRGWKPRQIEVNGEWVDVAGDCVELEELLGDSKIDGSKKVVEAVVDEARWVTMAHRHVLVSDDGEIMAGGPGAKKKFSSGAIKAAVVSANKKLKEA